MKSFDDCKSDYSRGLQGTRQYHKSETRPRRSTKFSTVVEYSCTVPRYLHVARYSVTGTSTCPIYPVLNLVARYEYRYLPSLLLKHLILNLVATSTCPVVNLVARYETYVCTKFRVRPYYSLSPKLSIQYGRY